MKTLEQQITHYHQHPASCLNQFDVQPIILAGIAFDGHGFSGRYPDELLENPNVVFEIKCSCGSNTHILLAESTTGDFSYYKSLVITDRYFLKCVSCENQSLLFEPSQNGYNAKVMRMEGMMRDETIGKAAGALETVICECAHCKGHTLEVYARFEYPDDLFDDPFFTGQEQEFFSWFTLVGKCSKCSTMSPFIDFECA